MLLLEALGISWFSYYLTSRSFYIEGLGVVLIGWFLYDVTKVIKIL